MMKHSIRMCGTFGAIFAFALRFKLHFVTLAWWFLLFFILKKVEVYFFWQMPHPKPFTDALFLSQDLNGCNTWMQDDMMIALIWFLSSRSVENQSVALLWQCLMNCVDSRRDRTNHGHSSACHVVPEICWADEGKKAGMEEGGRRRAGKAKALSCWAGTTIH